MKQRQFLRGFAGINALPGIHFENPATVQAVHAGAAMIEIKPYLIASLLY